jgi:hypothetical protein
MRRRDPRTRSLKYRWTDAPSLHGRDHNRPISAMPPSSKPARGIWMSKGQAACSPGRHGLPTSAGHRCMSSGVDVGRQSGRVERCVQTKATRRSHPAFGTNRAEKGHGSVPPDRGPPPLMASSPAKGEKQFFEGNQTEPPAAALITAPPNNSLSTPRGRPLVGLDPARFPVVVAVHRTTQRRRSQGTKPRR